MVYHAAWKGFAHMGEWRDWNQLAFSGHQSDSAIKRSNGHGAKAVVASAPCPVVRQATVRGQKSFIHADTRMTEIDCRPSPRWKPNTEAGQKIRNDMEKM